VPTNPICFIFSLGASWSGIWRTQICSTETVLPECGYFLPGERQRTEEIGLYL